MTALLRRYRFSTALRHPVLSVTHRDVELYEGPAGWGEFSPLPSWSESEVAGARLAAERAACEPFPAPVRDRVPVNVMVPRVTPEAARDIVARSGCVVAKVKVGDAGDTERLEAVRDVLGASGTLRLDANGAWADADTALRRLRELARFEIELCEDPVGPMEDIAALRARSPVPVAAESCVRVPADATRLRESEAADALVIKPQRIGGIEASLEAAERWGGPVIVSCALETSIGLAAVLAVAAALPSVPYACGIGTAMLLVDDPTSDPLLVTGGHLVPRRIAPDTTRLTPLSDE